MGRVYPSKRDTWIVALLLGSVIVSALAVIAVWIAGAPDGVVILVIVVCGVSGALVPWLLYGTYYVVIGTHLLVRCGPFRWSIPLADIDEIRPSRNPLSSPAVSLDRLHIRYQGSAFGILISPEDKSGFLQEILAVCPHLEWQGEGLVRKERARA